MICLRAIPDTPGRRWELEKQWAGDGNIEQWIKKLNALKVAHDIGDHEYSKDDKGDFTAAKEDVYLSAWWIKKGKGTDTSRDNQKRWFELVGPKPAIHYYKNYSEGVARNHKGMVLLTDG